jgi:hypothetical protein
MHLPCLASKAPSTCPMPTIFASAKAPVINANMPKNEVEIHESNSEHKQPTDNDVLPTMEPQTPLGTPHYQPFPYFAYSPYSMPSATPLAMPGNATHHLPTIYPHLLFTNSSHLATPATPINHEASARSTSTQTYRARQSNQQKLNELFQQLQDFSWTLGNFLYYAVWDKDERGKKITNRSDMHTQMASKFVGSFCKHLPVNIIEIWVRSP